MRVQRFFTSKHNIDEASALVSLDEPGLINQIRNVLRLRAGDRMVVLDGLGWLYECDVVEIDRRKVLARIVSKQPAAGEPPLRLTVALPLLRSGRFEWALEKLTELGASKVIPTICARTVAKSGGDRSEQARENGSKLARWQAIMREAAEQCERAAIPQVVDPMLFSQVLRESRQPGSGLGIICVERSNTPSLTSLLHMHNIAEKPPADILLIVGPEGGFTEAELRMVADTTLVQTSLGPRILRSETAAIYATALIISASGVDK